MEKLLSPEQVAEILGVSQKMVRDWLRAGRIKGVKLGRIWRVREQDLEAFLAEAERATASWAISPPSARGHKPQPRG